MVTPKPAYRLDFESEHSVNILQGLLGCEPGIFTYMVWYAAVLPRRTKTYKALFELRPDYYKLTALNWD
jgi:hypothetical protein